MRESGIAGGRLLVPALVLVLTSLPTSLAANENAASSPPDDAPAGAFPQTGPMAVPEELRWLIPPPVPIPPIPPNIGGGIWLAKGPGASIDGQVEAITPGPDEVSGAIHTVAAHPTDPDVLFVGATNGGIWKTTNATAASPMWTPLTDTVTSLSIGALEFDPTDPMHTTLVAGIGRYSSFGQLGGARTGFLLKTTDSGATWSSLAGFIGTFSPAGISGVAPRGMTIVASSNVSDAFFCADIGIWRSTDGGATFSSVSPLAAVPGPLGIAFDLAGDPTSPGTLYTAMTFVASICSPGSGFTNGVYKSVDTGLTWVKVSDATMDSLIVDGTTNNVEIAADGMDVFVNIIQSGRSVGIFHSANGGTSWTAMDLPRTPEGSPLAIGTVIPGAPVTIDTSPTPHGFADLSEEVEIAGVVGPAIDGTWTTDTTGTFTFDLVGSSDFTAWTPGTGTWQKVVGLSPKQKPGSQGGIHAAIRTDPATPTTVYLGGDRQDSPFPNFIGASDFSGRLFRGDATVAATGAIPSPQWEHLTHSSAVGPAGSGTASGSAPHADAREIVFDANGDLIEVDDGGIYRRTMPTSSAGDWFSLNGNIQVTEQHDVAYDTISNIIISGNQDTGTTQQMTPNGLVWDSVSTADGGDVAVADLGPAPSTRFSSFQNLGVYRRRTYDASNVLLSQMFPTLTPLGAFGVIGNFVTPVELNAADPSGSRQVIAGCNSVFESFDKADSITEIPGLVNPGCPGGSSILAFSQNAIAYGRGGGVPDADVLWVGAGPDVLIRPGPPPGPLVSTPTAFPGATVTDIVLDPTSSVTGYVTDSTDVYQTHDGGTTWTALTGNLTDTQIRSIAVDPAGGRLFVGGREGVSTLALPAPGAPAVGPFVWGQIGTGLPNAPVWDMEWDTTDGVLVVGTMGRGAWLLQENGACGKVDKLVVNNQWVGGVQLDEACTQITGGPSLDVTATGDLTFKSPSVILDNGFAVKTGGVFEVDNSVP